MKEFFVKVAMEIEKNQDDGSLPQVFKPILDLVTSKCKDFSIMHTEVNRYVDLLMFFTQTESLAKVILNHSFFEELIASVLECST